MAKRRMLVHLTRRVEGGEHERLSAALPVASFHSLTDTPNTAIGIFVEADSRPEAEQLAYDIAAAVLRPEDIDRLTGDDDTVQDRQVMFWLLATRHYLDEWESRLAEYLRLGFANQDRPGPLVWETQREHHMALNAANHLLRALTNAEGRYGEMPEAMATEIELLRHLHEHWDEQWKAFYNAQNPGPLKRSGKEFNELFPGQSPYWWLGWSSSTGPMIGPALEAVSLRSYLDDLEATVLANASHLERFVTARPASPWAGEAYGRDRWWPSPHTTHA